MKDEKRVVIFKNSCVVIDERLNQSDARGLKESANYFHNFVKEFPRKNLRYLSGLSKYVDWSKLVWKEIQDWRVFLPEEGIPGISDLSQKDHKELAIQAFEKILQMYYGERILIFGGSDSFPEFFKKTQESYRDVPAILNVIKFDSHEDSEEKGLKIDSETILHSDSFLSILRSKEFTGRAWLIGLNDCEENGLRNLRDSKAAFNKICESEKLYGAKRLSICPARFLTGNFEYHISQISADIQATSSISSIPRQFLIL